MKTCLECPARSKCKELCPAAEEYVNQDEVKQKERTLSELGFDSADNFSESLELEDDNDKEDIEQIFNNIADKYKFTDRQRQILKMKHVDEMREVDIAKQLEISKAAISNTKRKIKKKKRG